MSSASRAAAIFVGALISFVMPLKALAQTQSAGGSPAAQQTDVPPLTSNRPGIADSEELVPPRAFQVEAGGVFADAPPGEEHRWTQTWGQLTLRYGLTRRIEFFGGWDGLSLDRVTVLGQSRVVAGGNDLRVGAKFALLIEEANGLTVTIAPAWSFPTGSEAFTSGSQDPSFRILWARSLPREWWVWGNLLWSRLSDATSRYWETGAMIGLTRDLTERLSAFVEASNVLQADRPDNWTVDGGVARVIGFDSQLDFSVGKTFLHRGDDWFVSAGITLRRR
jgi:hypothetical protein